jgi:alpha-1,3-rhamnosyl/mannosyltransferase
MRISIDAIPLLVRSAGIKNYLFHWIAHLRLLMGDEQVRLFPFLDRLPDLDHEGSIMDPQGTLARQALLFALNLWPNSIADLMEPADVFHATKLRHPPRRARLTANLYDMTCWLLPELHQAANVAAEKLFAQCIWQKADGLIAISEATRTDAVKILHLDPETIQVIYPGIAQPFFESTAEAIAAMRLKYGLRQPYALYVGTVEPRKNVGGLLDAWQGLPAALREEFALVVAGPEGWKSSQTMTRLRSPAAGIHYLGYVPEPDLPALTAGATVFVYPSFYEGFGFPVAQAMAAGVPVITSDVSSLPEIAGGAAALIDPRSVAEIGQALARLLTSPAERAHRAQAGKSRAQDFRWETCARQTVEFFGKILERS